MTRRTKTVQLGDGRLRHHTRLEGRPYEIEGVDMWIAQMELLQDIANSPTVTACGPVRPTRLLIHAEGGRWVCDAEATEDASSP